jgi:hypothetical protein
MPAVFIQANRIRAQPDGLRIGVSHLLLKVVHAGATAA